MSNNFYGKSFFLEAVSPDGSTGVIQVFEIAKYGVGSDLDYWGEAHRRAREAAVAARDGWREYFGRVYPNEVLRVRMGTGSRCDSVVNWGVAS
jgi:hypothetical protein